MHTSLIEKEKHLIKLIEQARNRYDWVAYNRHFKTLTELKYDEARNERR